MVSVRSALACVALAACVGSCGVRAPSRIDVSALVKARGARDARVELEMRVVADPKDIGARLALAAVDEQLGRPSAAIEQLEVVVALGGPVGTRWHPDDRARLARLIAARGRARLARGAASALADLERARGLGATVEPLELARAKLARAVAQLRHVDAAERAAGMRLLQELATSPVADASWRGGVLRAGPAERGPFGAWLWQQGARRAAYDELAAWHDAVPVRDPALQAAFVTARTWWAPDDAAPLPASELAGPREAAPDAVAARPRDTAPDAASAARPREAATVAYVAARVPGGLAAATIDEITRGFVRDPALADRLAAEAVAASADAAIAHAAIGALFDALADPARARAAWQAAFDGSAEPAFAAGLAGAMARASDPDAALIVATTAAAASGDPAVVWLQLARELLDAGRPVHALETARSAIDLAGPEVLGDALDVAIAASRELGRTAQADALAQRRARTAPLVAPSRDGDPTDVAAALAAHRAHSTIDTVARLWTASRGSPRDVASRAALLAALPADDPRRATLVGELVTLAGDRDPHLARAAVDAVRR